METRRLGKTGHRISVIGLGCWQFGGDWGDVSEDQAMATLHAAADAGVTFFDTADVYGDGRSERLVGRFLRERPGAGVMVATKCGRRVAQDPANYTASSLRQWAERSRENLGLSRIPLTQLHCPPDAVYEKDAVFDALDDMVRDGILGAYGVSVETVAQGLRAIQRPGVATVQVIFNAFRLKPLERLLPACEKAGVGVIVRVPLASGLWSGRYTESTTFPPSDHRTYNRGGEAFDIGETFSGVPFEVGVQAAGRLAKSAVPEGWTLAEVALRWCADAPGVSTVIPGARSPEQAAANAAVGRRPRLPDESAALVRATYDEEVRDYVHDRW
jgi:aryl-alcohol dehydrogenase-like predicted oxidoreductase